MTSVSKRMGRFLKFQISGFRCQKIIGHDRHWLPSDFVLYLILKLVEVCKVFFGWSRLQRVS